MSDPIIIPAHEIRLLFFHKNSLNCHILIPLECLIFFLTSLMLLLSHSLGAKPKVFTYLSEEMAAGLPRNS